MFSIKKCIASLRIGILILGTLIFINFIAGHVQSFSDSTSIMGEDVPRTPVPIPAQSAQDTQSEPPAPKPDTIPAPTHTEKNEREIHKDPPPPPEPTPKPFPFGPYARDKILLIGPNIAGYVCVANFLQVRQEHNAMDIELREYWIPIAIIWTTDDLRERPAHLSFLLKEMVRYGLVPNIRIEKWGEVVSPEEAKQAAESLNDIIGPYISLFPRPLYAALKSEPNAPYEWGGAVDPLAYADALEAFLQEARFFMVTNAPMNITAGNVWGHMDAVLYWEEVRLYKPGLLEKLDATGHVSYESFGDPPGERYTKYAWLWEREFLMQEGVSSKPAILWEAFIDPRFYTQFIPDYSEGISYIKEIFLRYRGTALLAVTPLIEGPGGVREGDWQLLVTDTAGNAKIMPLAQYCG